MNKRHYEHTLPNIRGSLSNTYFAYTYTIPRIGNKKISERSRIWQNCIHLCFVSYYGYELLTP